MIVFLLSIFSVRSLRYSIFIAAFEFALANFTCRYITNFAFSQLPIVRCLIQAFLHSDILCRKERSPDVYFSSFFSVSL